MAIPTDKEIRFILEQCAEDGIDDPELVCIRTGLPLATVERFFAHKTENRSAREMLIDDIKKSQRALDGAYTHHEDRPGQSAATAIATLHRTRQVLIKELQELEDPATQAKLIDNRVIGQLIRSILLDVAVFVASAGTDVKTAAVNAGLDPEKVTESFRRNYELLGARLHGSYKAAVVNLTSVLGADADVVLESDPMVKELLARVIPSGKKAKPGAPESGKRKKPAPRRKPGSGDSEDSEGGFDFS